MSSLVARPTCGLSAAELEHLRQLGFVVVPALLSRAEIAIAGAEFEAGRADRVIQTMEESSAVGETAIHTFCCPPPLTSADVSIP